MELNSNIWGDESHQILQSSEFSNHITVSDVIPDIYTYYNTIGMSEHIDNSIALWQLGDDSWFNRQLFLRRDGNNIIQKNERNTINAKSIWLCVPVTFNTNQNIHFNPTQYQCNLWDSDNTSSYYNQPNANLRGIITGFDYNRLVLRHRLRCKLYDSNTGIHSGNTRNFSVYDYFNGIDSSDNIPYRDKYCIEAITCVVGSSKGNTEITPYQISMNIPLNAPKTISASARIYTNTLYNTPETSNNYYKSNYIYYAQSNDIIGIERVGISAIPQQAVFADNTSYYIDSFASDMWVLDEFRDGNTNYIATRCIGRYDDIMKQLALFGFWFIDNDTFGNTITAITGPDCNDEHVCLPEIIDGRTTGNYKRGVQAGADPQAQWGNQWREHVGYNGDKPYHNEESSSTPFFNSIKLDTFSNIYMLRADNIYGLANELKTYVSGETYNPNYFYGQEPIECIAMLKIFPFDMLRMQCSFEVRDFDWVRSFAPIKIGQWETTNSLGIKVDSLKTDGEDDYTLWQHSEFISGNYNDFRDYEPYSSYDLYLPFCGTLHLPANVIVNHNLTVRYTLDGISGLLSAYILIDNKIYKSLSGNCAIDIPVSGYKISEYISNMLSISTSNKIASTEIVQAWGNIISGIGNGLMSEGINIKHAPGPLVLAGAITQAVGSTMSSGAEIEKQFIKKGYYAQNLDHSAPQPAFVQNGKGLDSWASPMGIYLLVQSPKMLEYNKDIYAKTTGHACCIYDTLASQHDDDKDNLVQVNDIILDDIPLTEVEKRNLLSLLQSGVII